MAIIIPAIIPQSHEHLCDVLSCVKIFTSAIQIDITDGIFVPSVSWPYIEPKEMPFLYACMEGFDIEFDLMIDEPEKVLERYCRIAPSRIVIHLESVHNMHTILLLKETYNFKLGLSISNDTPLEVLYAHIAHADYVQCMGIADIGVQGNPFDARVYTRIRTLKEMYPEKEISVDGGVNTETLPKLKEAGATRFAVGSAILKTHVPEEAYRTLVALV